jgi:hypothetical protein
LLRYLREIEHWAAPSVLRNPTSDLLRRDGLLPQGEKDPKGAAGSPI